jgi:hypothetical protein
MSIQASSANILNGSAGLLGAIIAGFSAKIHDLGFYSEAVAQIGGMIIVALTIINGVFMARKHWRDRHK